MNKSTKTLIGLFLLLPAVATAGEGGPFPLVLHQAFNLTILISAIIYFTRSAIISHFKSRRETYLAEAEKTLRLKKEAEAKLKDIEQRLLLLEKTKNDSIAKAHEDAAALRKRLVLEAEETAQRVRKEAGSAAAAEVQRAKQKLLEKMSRTALEEAQGILKKDISGADQGRLQESLLQQI